MPGQWDDFAWVVLKICKIWPNEKFLVTKKNFGNTSQVLTPPKMVMASW